MEQEYFDETHPGFTIKCNKCGSTKVYLENDMGWSDLSGSWGGIHLICNECESKTTIAGDD